MLQSNKAFSAEDQNALAPVASSPAERINTVLGFLRRQYPVIFPIALLTVAMAAVYVSTMTPSFTAKANLLIDTRKLQVLQQPPILGDLSLDVVTLESQIQIIQSDPIAVAVINRLGLAEDPEFVGSGGRLMDTLSSVLFGVSRSVAPPTEAELTEGVLRAFQKRLTVTRVGASSVIAIQFRSADPERAAQIANAVGEAYIAEELKARKQASKRAGDWLQDRIPELRKQSSEAERAVVDFREKNNIVSAAGRLMDEQKVADLNSQLVTARAQTSEALARLDRIDAIIRADGPNSTNLATVSDALSNPIITQLRLKYLEHVNREADWSARYGRNHLAVVNLRRQIAEIRGSLLDELRRIGETYKSEYAIAKQRQSALEESLKEAEALSRTTSKAQTTLRELENSAEQYRTLFDTFVKRYTESVQQEAIPMTEARLISRASKMEAKKDSKRFLILAVAVAGGFGLGIGFGVLREIMDRVFRTRGQVEKMLQTDCVAEVPMLQGGQAKELPFKQESAKTVCAQTILKSADTNLIWDVVDTPFSRYADAIRSIKVSLDLKGVVGSKIIGFTSSLPSEGKSTVAGSFALLAAQSGARVILVDCDLLNASLSRILAPNAAYGIEDVIAGKSPLDDAICTDPSTNLSFLPSRVNSKLPHSNELLGSEALKELFSRLRQSYEYIVVDLSPLAPVVDVRATARFIDYYMFIIEWGQTKIDLVEHTLAGAQAVYENLHGIVLNKVDVKLLSRYESRGTASYYGKLAA
jgi:succinoglycan biosynthesis transport protein ExoP